MAVNLLSTTVPIVKNVQRCNGNLPMACLSKCRAALNLASFMQLYCRFSLYVADLHVVLVRGADVMVFGDLEALVQTPEAVDVLVAELLRRQALLLRRLRDLLPVLVRAGLEEPEPGVGLLEPNRDAEWRAQVICRQVPGAKLPSTTFAIVRNVVSEEATVCLSKRPAVLTWASLLRFSCISDDETTLQQFLTPMPWSAFGAEIARGRVPRHRSVEPRDYIGDHRLVGVANVRPPVRVVNSGRDVEP